MEMAGAMIGVGSGMVTDMYMVAGTRGYRVHNDRSGCCAPRCGRHYGCQKLLHTVRNATNNVHQRTVDPPATMGSSARVVNLGDGQMSCRISTAPNNSG